MRILLAILLLITFVSGVHAEKCNETVRIDTTDYNVGSRWCGKKIDTTLIPVYEDFGRVPKQFCFDSSKIYILKDARDAFVIMAEAAAKDSVHILVKSGFRSPSYQKRLVKKRMEKGESVGYIFSYVAPPGYSEHHTGRAVDLTVPDKKFSKTKVYEWLKKNAEKFGFIETYPKDNKTLKTWEPWHWTYSTDNPLSH